MPSINTQHTYYIFSEDFVAVVIGPFETREAAEEHPRAGDAHNEIVTDVVAKHLRGAVGWQITPERDIELQRQQEGA